MKKLKEYAIIFLSGGLFYALIEILWRGYTHWSMAVTGGGCVLGLYVINIKRPLVPLWKRCAGCSLFITAVEFTVGCIVNLRFRWHVWDYSDMKLNILGQVCPLFTLMWFFLCIPGSAMCRLMYDVLHGEEKSGGIRRYLS